MTTERWQIIHVFDDSLTCEPEMYVDPHKLQSKLTRALEGLKELERSTEYEAKLAESAEDDKRHVLLFRGLMLHARKTREDVEGMK